MPHAEPHLALAPAASCARWLGAPCATGSSDTELKLVRIADDASSHALVNETDNTSVRVLPIEENWPLKEVKDILRDG